MLFIAKLRVLLGSACLAAAAAASSAADPPRVGIVAGWKFEKGVRSVPYQQVVWRNLLGNYRMFATEAADDAALDDPAVLRQFRCLIIPSSRPALTRAQMDNLAQYVRAGGKLIRDQHAASMVGQMKDAGWACDTSPASRAAAASFWRTVGGVENCERLPAREIRFPPERGALVEFLPADFTPVEALCHPDFEHLRHVACYKLAGAQALMEARPDPAEGGKSEPQTAAAIHQYGAGQCLCLGINVRGLTGIQSPMAMYRDFMANVILWIVE